MATLHLRNALTTRQKQPFVPVDPQDVRVYCCGPTVYDEPHLGHARTYVFLDVLVRILRHHLGYGVRVMMNVTDLDDKIIERGGPRIARVFERLFFQTMDRLNVRRPDIAPRVTDHLESAWTVVQDCLAKGYAYRDDTNAGNVYFDTRAYLEQKKKRRVFVDTEKRDANVSAATPVVRKKDPRDFTLWKKKSWIDTEGRRHSEMPGWHTECACLKIQYFGNRVDILIGGSDLQFPHHENEITLGRVFFDTEQWVHFCLYAGHLRIEGQKMSKSLKNFTTVEEIIADGYSPLALRYLFLKHPYDSSMNFSEEELKSAQKSYDNFMYHIENVRQSVLRDDIVPEYHDIPLKKIMNDALLDNLNVPLALRHLEEYVRDLLRDSSMSLSKVRYSFDYIEWVADNYFGLLSTTPRLDSYDLIPLIQCFRTRVRKHALNQKDDILLSLCDEIREELKQKGYVMDDMK